MIISAKPLENAREKERVEKTTFDLPWPPSVNRVWRVGKTNGRGSVYRSEKYETFLNQTRALAFERKIPAIRKAQAYRVEIDCHPPNARKYDVDNRIKATFDALTRAGFWEDDSLVKEVVARKRPVRKQGGLIRVTVEIVEPEGE